MLQPYTPEESERFRRANENYERRYGSGRSGRDPESDLAKKLIDLGSALEQGVPRAEWLGLRGRYARGAMTCTGGYTGAGKTPLHLSECRALLAGESFLGFPFVPGSISKDFAIAYLTQETEATFLPAAAKAGLSRDLVSGRMEIGFFHAFATDDWEQTVEDVARHLDGDGLLVVDTIGDWSRTRDENDNAMMAAALRPLQMALGTGIAVAFVSHTQKSFVNVSDADADSTAIRGGGSIIANASMVYTYKVGRPKMEGDPRHLKRHRSRLDCSGVPEGQYVIEEAGALRRVRPIEHWLRLIGKSAERLLEYLREQGEPVLKSAAKADLEMSGSTIETAVEKINGEEGPYRVEVTGRGVAGSPHRLLLVEQ